MSSENVTTAVAKRLKYYLDIQRREDAFDLSGPNHPERNRPFVRPGSSLAYDGLHDRSLKHYYREKGVKQQLQKMKTVDGLSGRENQVKKRIERTMQEYNYKPTNKVSPYSLSLFHPRASAHEEYFKKRSSPKKKKRPNVVVGKKAKIGRRAPDETISLREKDRLVNMATKLIVATETIALPKNRKSGKGSTRESQDNFPVIAGNERRASSASDPGPRATPHPPKHRYVPKSAIEKRWFDSPDEISLDSTLDSVRSQMQHLKLDPKDDSIIVSHDRAANNANGSVSQTKPRPKSAVDALSHNQADSDFDDFYDPSNFSSLASPRRAWKASVSLHSADTSTQTTETRGTQTDFESATEKDLGRRSTENDATLTYQVNSKINSEPKVVPYEVYVVTGDKLGAGTSSDVKINIFGKLGSSGERPLIRSKKNKKPFERKQVDLFTIDSTFLGDLSTIRIGHNGTALGTGWFLDRVVIRDENSPIAFEFKCQRWLSARDDDGQIIRDLPLSSTIQAHEVPEIKEAKRPYLKNRSDSFSGLEGRKLQFRPLSATKKSISDLDKHNLAAIRDSEKQDKKKAQEKYTPTASVDSSTDEEGSKGGKEDAFLSREKDRDGAKKVDEISEPKKKIEDEEKAQTSNGENKSVVDSNKAGRKEDKQKKSKSKSADSRKEKEIESKSDRNSLDDSKKDKNSDALTTKEEYKEKRSEDTKDHENVVNPVEYDEKEKEDESNSSDSSNDESSSSDSELFSVTSSSSSNSESESESDATANEEEIERISKDTSKKKDSDSEDQKESGQNDYMAGFLAGVRAKEQDNLKEAMPTESVVTKGANIHQASQSGDFERVKELVNEVPELKSKPDERGWAPLHTVAAFGHLEILKWLSVNGVNLEEQTPTGFSAIHLASMNGHVKCIMVLAAMGCPISSKAVDGRTPLHLAAMSGHVECLKWLLANRANPNLRDVDGRTPYDIAVEYQQDECIELLELMNSEMRRKDSVITRLRHPNNKSVDEPSGSTFKESDSGIGGTESGEDGWISDVEADVIGRGDRVPSAKSRGQSATAVRKKSKQEERAIEEIEGKRRMYEKQQKKMQKRESTFLDSIRQEVDSGDEDQDF